MKNKDIITKIKKAYEVKTPEISDKLYFPQNETVYPFPKRTGMSMRKVRVCGACLALIMGAVTITAMHFNTDDGTFTPFTPIPTPSNVILDNQLTAPGQTDSAGEDIVDNIFESEPPKLSYKIPYACDYAIPTDQMTMFNAADLVIEGVYGGTVSVSANEIGQIISTGKVSNIKILKGGEMAEKELLISYYGGTMKISDYREQVNPEYLLKCGFDKLSKEEADNKYISFIALRELANPQQGLKYLMFLVYDDTTNGYFVFADGYGIREINAEGKAWNIDSSEYETINYKEMEMRRSRIIK